MREGRSRWRIAAASGPLRFVAAVFAFAALLMAAPPVLRFLNHDSFRAPVDEIRNPDFAAGATDEARAAARAGALRYRTTAWEREWREQYESNTPPTVSFFGPPPAPRPMAQSTTLHAPTEEIALPTGAAWRVVAIVAAANPTPSMDPMGRRVAVDGEILRADMTPMPAEEVAALCAKYSQEEAEMRRFDLEGETAAAFRICVDQTGPRGEDEFPFTRFATDARTGWTITGSNAGMESFYFGHCEGGTTIMVQYTFETRGWSAGPCVAWFDWRAKVEEELELSPYPGSEVVHLGSTIRVEEVAERTDSGWTIHTVTGDRTADRIDAVRQCGGYGGNDTFTAFRVTGAGEAYTGLVPRNAAGDAIRSSMTMKGRSGTENCFGFATPLGDIDSLVLQYQPGINRVGIRLPFVPGLPEGNRAIADFADAVIPPMAFESGEHARKALGRALQTRFDSGMGFLDQPTIESPKTVRDLLEAYRPDASYVLAQHLDTMAGEHYTAFMFAGAVRGKYAPGRARVFDQLFRPSGVVEIVLAVLALFAVAGAVQSKRLGGHLRARGHDAFGFAHVALLWLLLGRRAWRIPHADELGTIPGVDPRSARSVLRFMATARGR